MTCRFAVGFLALSCAGCAELAAERSVVSPTTASRPGEGPAGRPPAPAEPAAAKDPDESGPTEPPAPVAASKPPAGASSRPSSGIETTPATAIPPPGDPLDRLALEPAPIAIPPAEPSSPPRDAAPPSGRPAPPPGPPTIPGRAVARVGSEVVTLPELTSDVKGRIARISGGAEPTRRQIIALARSALETRIQRSLILQEARRRLDAPGQLDEALEAIDRRWQAEEFPRLLRREGAIGEDDLAPRLAGRGLSLDDLRDRYRTRSLAIELIRRETGGDPGRSTDREIAAYVEKVRKRIPVESVMTQAEVAAASGDPASTRGPLRGRRAAEPDGGAGP